MINIPAATSSWPMWVDGQAYQYPAVMPAASARMSSRPSAIWRSSSIDSVQVAFLHGVPHGGAVQGAVEQLILGAHTSAYRMQIRFRQSLNITSPRRPTGSYPLGVMWCGDRRGQTATLVNRPGSGAVSDNRAGVPAAGLLALPPWSPRRAWPRVPCRQTMGQAMK